MSSRVAVTTIVAKNYLAQAGLFFRSFHEHDPGAELFVFVVDDESFDEQAAGLAGVSALAVTDLMPRAQFLAMAAMYDVTELCTAVKPFVLQALLERGYDGALYFDPDIAFFAPIEPILEALSASNVVLIPHLLDPIPLDGKQPTELGIMQAGAYNLGFIGISKTPEALRFLEWWASRLDGRCIVDFDHGLFVDQKWIDLVPGLFEGVTILRARGLDVAYWNLHARPLGRDYRRLANGEPLIFFHYSAFDPELPGELSRHQSRVVVEPGSSLAKLLEHIGRELIALGHRELREVEYGYARFSNGVRMDAYTRHALRSAIERGRRFADPFDAAPKDSFFAYLTEPEAGDVDALPPVMTPYLRAVWESSPGPRLLFPDLEGERDRRQFFRWTRVRVWNEENDLFIRSAHLPRTRVADPEREELGINIIGYFRKVVGIGEAGRGYGRAARALGIPVRLIDFSLGSFSRRLPVESETLDLRNDLPVNLVCVNADQVPLFTATVGERFFRGKYNIGSWWWELPRLPAEWHPAFAVFDEIWAGSEFVRGAIARDSPIPVVRVPPVVEMPDYSAKGKRDFGLSEDDFVFLFTFDFFSIYKRKNPRGVVTAFKRAFAEGGRVRLLLKVINGEADRVNFEDLQAACAGAPITIMNESLSEADKNALVKCADAYVSLHRSEGFGLTLAEAMLMGKPVIATGWSGNMDFMSSANSFPVDYAPVAVGPGAEPYPAEQIWAEPDLDHAALLMRFVAGNPSFARDRAMRAALDIERNYSIDAVAAQIAERIDLIRERRAFA